MNAMKFSEWSAELLKTGVGAESVFLMKKCLAFIFAFDKAIFPNDPIMFCFEKDNATHIARYVHNAKIEALGVESDVYGVNPFSIQRDLKEHMRQNHADAVAFLLEVEVGVVPPERDSHIRGDYHLGRIAPMSADQAIFCIAVHEVRHKVQQRKGIKIFSPGTKFPESDKQNVAIQRIAKQIADSRKRQDPKINFDAEFDAHFIEICASCLTARKTLFDKDGHFVVGDDIYGRILNVLTKEPPA